MGGRWKIGSRNIKIKESKRITRNREAWRKPIQQTKTLRIVQAKSERVRYK